MPKTGLLRSSVARITNVPLLAARINQECELPSLAAPIKRRAEPGEIEVALWSVRLRADESADLKLGWPRVKGMAMERIILDAEAGQVSAELVRRGIAPNALVHVLVEVRDAGELSMAPIDLAGGAFDWLADEPDLYTDADLVERAG
jgi:hypothetical protein